MCDLGAGLVIAALSIPISMGYAGLVGLPAIYGLYASIIPPLAFILFSKTSKIVFGLDGATVAITASMLSLLGITTAESSLIIMPFLTLLVALFLLLFRIFHVGSLIKMIPLPVLHGFIFGIAITVIFHQLPHMLGLSVHLSDNIFEAFLSITSIINTTSVACLLISIGCIILLVLSQKFLPQFFPSAIVVLFIATIFAFVINSFIPSSGIIFLSEVSGSLPKPIELSFDTINNALSLLSGKIFECVIAAFVIAIVVALESLLCLEAFSSAETKIFSPNKEITALGGANLFAALFCCLPSSATMSRTAAGISAGAKTKLATIFSVIIISLVTLFAGSFMDLLPRCALSAIVVVALVNIVDWSKMKTYAKKMRYDFAISAVSAVLVITFGAITGVVVGVILACAFMLWQKKNNTEIELVGAIPYTTNNEINKKEIINNASIFVYALPKSLSFANISKTIDDIIKGIDGNKTLILKASNLARIDSSAGDRLRSALETLAANGIDIKIVRKIRETKDHITRYEIRRIMRDFSTYPSLPTALEAVAQDGNDCDNLGLEKTNINKKDITSANNGIIFSPSLDMSNEDIPVVTISALRNIDGDIVVKENNYIMIEDVKGKLSFMEKKKSYLFKAEYAKIKKTPRDNAERKCLFSKIVVYNEEDGKIVMDYRNGKMESILDDNSYDLIASQIAATVIQLLEE